MCYFEITIGLNSSFSRVAALQVAMEVKLPVACLLLRTLILLTAMKEAQSFRENGDLKGGVRLHIHRKNVLLLIVVIANSNPGNVVHWALKLFHHFAEDADRQELFGGRSLAIQRERPMDLAEDWDRTGLRLVK